MTNKVFPLKILRSLASNKMDFLNFFKVLKKKSKDLSEFLNVKNLNIFRIG
jgi:hypothetical protein